VSNENAVRNLIRIDDKANPTLFRALQLLIDDLYRINNEVFPPSVVGVGDNQGGVVAAIGPVLNFTGTAYPDNLRLDWDNLPGAFRYQIKMGLDWDSAKPIIVTATDVANIDPVFLNLVYGTYNFIIRPWNFASVPGLPASATLIVPVIGPPDLSLEVVVSTVLLKWTVPASAWRISHYIIYKNNIEIGTIAGTFKLIQEQVGGTYTYEVAAVDIVGNVGQRSGGKTADLHDPSEFEFVDELEADYTGIYVNTEKTIIDNIVGIVGPVISPETWQEHFVNNSFGSPQDQIDAGYPVYFQPAFIGEGSYEEIFDFGQLYEKLTVVADYNKTQLVGSTFVHTEISHSEDGITYSVPVITNSLLVNKFQYVKVKWVFTNADDLSLAFISNLKVLLNVTLTLDSGTIDCSALDADGTLVTYNKTFTGISSVTATPTVSVEPLYSICDAVNKDNFKILIFDSSGNRESASVSWKARGVV